MIFYYKENGLARLYDTTTTISHKFNRSGEEVETGKLEYISGKNFSKVNSISVLQSQQNCVYIAEIDYLGRVKQQRVSLPYSDIVMKLLRKGTYLDFLTRKGVESGISYLQTIAVYSEHIDTNVILSGLI